ncbi:MAG: hypothetical protein AB7F40_03145 [Victivallaceae bacterium]|nr:hypothetical protein [Victivallaceae bacterium]
MINKILRWASLLPALAAAGCIWSDYHETRYYDMQSPEPLPALRSPVTVGVFANATPVRQRMLFSRGDGEVVVDEYNRFVQPPDQMLVRYLSIAFGSQNDTQANAPVIAINGRIFMFEFDLAKNEARCGVDYTMELRRPDGIVEPIRTESVIFRSEASSADPDVVARAFSRCLMQLADRLYGVADQSADKTVNPRTAAGE